MILEWWQLIIMVLIWGGWTEWRAISERKHASDIGLQVGLQNGALNAITALVSADLIRINSDGTVEPGQAVRMILPKL